MSYVLGYTVAHDVSARDWQLKRSTKDKFGSITQKNDQIKQLNICQNWFQHMISFRNGGQWLAGKAMDSFCPIGPAIATRFDHFYLRCRHHNDDPSTNACFCVLTTSQFKIIPSNISNNRWIFQGRDRRPPQLEPLMYCQRSCKTGSPLFICINESSSLSIIQESMIFNGFLIIIIVITINYDKSICDCQRRLNQSWRRNPRKLGRLSLPLTSDATLTIIVIILMSQASSLSV